MAYERRRWFKAVKAVLRLIIKEPKFIYLGEEVRASQSSLHNKKAPSPTGWCFFVSCYLVKPLSQPNFFFRYSRL